MGTLEKPPDFVIQSDAVGGIVGAEEFPWVRLSENTQPHREWMAIHCERCNLAELMPTIEPSRAINQFVTMPSIVRLLAHRWRWRPRGECIVYIGQCPDCWTGYWYAEQRSLDGVAEHFGAQRSHSGKSGA